jgi:hypothetical protein
MTGIMGFVRSFCAPRLLVSATITIMVISAMSNPVLASDANFDYSFYGDVLSTYVNDKGMVDYKSLKQNRKKLDSFHEKVASLAPAEYEKWSKDAKIAFLINIYNSLTLKAIINNYPIEKSLFRPSAYIYPENSIRQIPGVWDETTHTVMGKSMTLDHIEHGILRKEFNEPRIHMALVCAAMGCPVLRDEPYEGPKLDEQLDEQSKKFINSPDKFRIDKNAGKVYLSSIFKWFGEDFVDKYRAKGKFKGKGDTVSSVLNFAANYLKAEEVEYLKSGDYSIEYLDYDWSLNEQ